MDLNELLRRHQLALIAVRQSCSAVPCSAAARSADEYAARIKKDRPAQARYPVVLSVQTLLALSDQP